MQHPEPNLDSTLREELRTHAEDSPISLPPEIWRKIIAFTVRYSLGSRIDIEEAFQATDDEEAAEIADSDLLSDRKRLAQVSPSWRMIVAEIAAECLSISSSKTLASLVTAFEDSKTQKNRISRQPGEITRRIDIGRFSDYNYLDDEIYHVQLVQLLKCTPNLLIYTHHKFGGDMDTSSDRNALTVFATLIVYCGCSLRRVVFAPSRVLLNHQVIVMLCNVAQNLVTLCLSSRVRKTVDAGINPNEHDPSSLLCLPKLKNLSLYSETNPIFLTLTSGPLDYFVQCLSVDSKQLPLLEIFTCNVFPPSAPAFFRVHGRKIRQLQAPIAPDLHDIPGAMESCTNLITFVVSGCMPDDLKLPSTHPTLERICIDRNVFPAALKSLLHLIEKMDAPCLNTVQLHKGVLRYPNSNWLHPWYGQFEVRGIRLVDEMGASSFDSLPKPVQIDSGSDYDLDISSD